MNRDITAFAVELRAPCHRVAVSSPFLGYLSIEQVQSVGDKAPNMFTIALSSSGIFLVYLLDALDVPQYLFDLLYLSDTVDMSIA